MGVSGHDIYDEEKLINGVSIIITRRIIKKIDIQLQKNICKININNSSFGIGFFCKIPHPDEFKLLPVLITNNHVLNQEFYTKNEEIKISFDDDRIVKLINIIPERKFYFNNMYDVSIIEIFPNKDNIHNFLEINEDVSFENKENYENLNIYVLQYSNEGECSVSYGRIDNINEYEIEHKCSTTIGSSGSPIMLLDNFKVIGIHKGSSKNKEHFNYGTLLRYPILEFNSINNEIIIKVKIEENDINKDVYILNYPYYTKEDGKKLEYNGLKEMTKINTLMFINNEKVEYEKYKKFDKKGIYKIKIISKMNLTNAYCMFQGCKNIIDIDLSKFETSYINNMGGMFRGCKNLININLSSFSTKNVTRMNCMFHDCINLKNINLISFDTKKVTKMNYMFYNCKNLNNIDLSSFETQNVKDMSGMFYECNNLTHLNLSSFDTKNVTKMSFMFFACKKIIELDLSSFDTRNVIKMSCMFDECINLKNINLSSFDTKNVTNMGCMFNCCNNLTNIDLSSFDTKNVVNMSCIFRGCKNFTSLNLSSFDTKKVNDMSGMFYDCNNLKELNLSSFDSTNLSNFQNIFSKCNNLVHISIASIFYNSIKSELNNNIQITII